MIPSTVTIAGWTGDEAGPNGPSIEECRKLLWGRLNAEHHNLIARYDANEPEARRIVREAGLDNMFGFYIAYAHRHAAPLVNELAAVTGQALNAVEQAGAEYGDLSKNTTVNWLAAHHRFVLTTQRARQLLERRVQIAEELLQHKRHLDAGEPGTTIYAKFVPAEHRIVMPDLDALKVEVTNFVEISTERFATTRVTVTGGYPEGFEPAPIETEPFERPADDEIAWTNGSFYAVPAVVTGARNW